MSKAVTDLAKGLHETSRRLHPAVLNDLGLFEALRQECARIAEHHNIRVHCNSRRLPEEISDDISLCLYRVAQECLWNICHNAKAREVLLVLRGGKEEIILTVEDDGCGFVRESVSGKGGLGLVSMEERVRLLSGKLPIVSKPGAGTRVEVHLPSPTTN